MEIIKTQPSVTLVASKVERISHYVDRYRTFARNTAENIVGLGQTVYEASEELAPSEVRDFCIQVGIEHNGPTYRKMRQIGTQAEKLFQHLAALPNNWTTVYEVAKMDEGQFQCLIESNVLSPTVTMREINDVVKPKKQMQGERLQLVLTLVAETPAEAFQMEHALRDVMYEHSGHIRFSDKALHARWATELNGQKLAA